MNVAKLVRGGIFLGTALLLSTMSGCADTDACQGRTETCLSLTLSGSDGVSEADQLEVEVQRMPKPQMPMAPLGEPRPLPFKVAVLWPDGSGTISVRSYLQGKLNGVTAELRLDLRNGAHDKRKLTLYPPLSGTPLGDLGGPPPPRDMATHPPDLSTQPADMTAQPADMSTQPDMAAPPPDMAMTSDMTAPADMPAKID